MTAPDEDEDAPPVYGPACDDDCPCYMPPPAATATTAPATIAVADVAGRLGLLDRLLSVWILVAMGVGLLVGYYAPAVGEALRSIAVGGVSLPLAIGLVLMLLPVFAKVPYERLRDVLGGRELARQLGLSFALNWLVGPVLMTALAWATLPDLPSHRNGVILVGLARCIAMVLLWNTLAHGSAEYCTVLVAFNACLQLVLYSPMAVLFINVLSPDAGATGDVGAFFGVVTEGVLVFMGVPFVLGVAIRLVLRRAAGARWYDETFVPRFSPLALLGLLYTIVVLFAVQGRDIVNQIGPVARVAVSMLIYFALMFGGALALALRLRLPYALAVTQAFTAASNNFELAIAIAVATFGATSPEALAAVVGPLIEVPVLLGLVTVALRLEPWWHRRVPAPAAVVPPVDDSEMALISEV